jgi:GxxExxY protein
MQTFERIVLAASDVHEALGPGHTEATYHSALEHELSERGIAFTSEQTIPIFYKGTPVGKRRPDLFVETDDGKLVLELKAGSGKGEDQLFSYQDILDDDNNFNIVGGVLIRFNDELEVVKS